MPGVDCLRPYVSLDIPWCFGLGCRKEGDELLKARNSGLIGFSQVAPVALAPIGGAISTFGLNLPFLVSAGAAVAGYFVVLAFFKDVNI